MSAPLIDPETTYLRPVLLVLGGLLALRIAVIGFSSAELYADEAQYWRWSRELAWGYYSKPPMIAWVIGTMTGVFGNSEFAIRLAAPILHAIAALSMYGLGRAMYGARIGLLAALAYSLMPGVTLSATLISTDGVLLPFWCSALFLLWRLRQGDAGWLGAVGLGLCIGAAFLSKYATLYLFIGLGLTAAFDGDTRRAILSIKGVAALLIAAAMITPHLLWNAANDFATVGHTVDNANLGGDLINPENLVKFLSDQMGVFGPISFLALIGGIVTFVVRKRGEIDRRDLWLLAFIVPVIVIIAGQSVLSRAHANWAATAYPAASVLVSAWLVRAMPNRWLWLIIAGVTFAAFFTIPDMALWAKAGVGAIFGLTIACTGALNNWRPSGLLWTSIGLHGALAAVLSLFLVLSPSITTALGLDNAFKRVRGWEATAEMVAQRAAAENATAILVDEREVWHGLDYYLRAHEHPPLLDWRRYGGPKSFSENRPLTDDLDGRVLVVSYRAGERPRMRADFEMFEGAGDLEIALGERSNGCPITRRLALYIAQDYNEQTRDQAWEDQYQGLSERPNPPCPARE
ncbi:MAG: glycosyltransferase family 39 protein [Pseudomonadota bacterium]